MNKELISSLEKHDTTTIKRTILKRILDKVLIKKRQTKQRKWKWLS